MDCYCGCLLVRCCVSGSGHHGHFLFLILKSPEGIQSSQLRILGLILLTLIGIFLYHATFTVLIVHLSANELI